MALLYSPSSRNDNLSPHHTRPNKRPRRSTGSHERRDKVIPETTAESAEPAQGLSSK